MLFACHPFFEDTPPGTAPLGPGLSPRPRHVNCDSRRCNEALRKGGVGSTAVVYQHKGAFRGTPGSACPQPEPNATELSSCAPISARAAQRWRRRRWWRGEEDARRLGPKGQVLRHVLWHVLRNALRRVHHALPLGTARPKPVINRRSHGGTARLAITTTTNSNFSVARLTSST